MDGVKLAKRGIVYILVISIIAVSFVFTNSEDIIVSGSQGNVVKNVYNMLTESELAILSVTNAAYLYKSLPKMKLLGGDELREIHVTKDREDSDYEDEDKDKDGFGTYPLNTAYDNNDLSVRSEAEEVCGDFVNEDCDGYDETCESTLESVIKSRNIGFVKEEVLRRVKESRTARVLIKLKDPAKKADVKREMKPLREVGTYVSVEVAEADMTNILRALGPGDVEFIQLDHRMKLALGDVVNITGVSEVWGMNITGKGQTVCVVDSGVDYNHPNLSGNYIGGFDFVNNDSDPMDDNGHGTYVSGVVTRIAKDVKILAVKVFDAEGNGYESDILAGIDYCIRKKDEYNVSVMLMAFGGGIFNTSCYCDSNPVASESNFAVSQGIFVVASSGNDAGEYLKAPACGTNVTSVGAVDKLDKVANFTNIEPLLDILAPGVGVESAKAGGGMKSGSGTSASAAVVAGIAPLVLENESLPPADLQFRLRATGYVVAHNGTDYPRVDAYAAVTGQITNTPGEQSGRQCEGAWEDYESLLLPPCPPSCDENADCRGCCDDVYRCPADTRNYCSGGGDCVLGYCFCSKAGCGAECDSDDDCPSDGWYCRNAIRENRNYYCNTGPCTCAYSVTGSEDCNAKQSYDSEAPGKIGTCNGNDQDIFTKGYVDNYIGCSGGSCGVDRYWDYCESGNVLKDSCVGTGGTGYGYYTYDCDNTCVNTYYTGKCSDGRCVADVDCRTQCGSGYQAYAHYTGCSGGSCTGLTCTKGVCGANCDGGEDCPSSCTGTCGTGTDSCMWKVGNCPLSGTTIHICACHYYDHDPDEAEGYCTGCGQKWNLGGSGDCTGENCLSNCCGDDSGEKYRYCQAGTGFPDSGTCTSADDTCCDNTNDCVDVGGVYCTTSGTHATDGDGDGDDDYCLNGLWYDCYNDGDCLVEHSCVSNNCVDNTINGGSGTVCDASNPCFYIKDSAGTVKARFDDNGYIDVKGGYYSGQGTLSPPSNSFIIKDSGGTVRLYIDSSGNLYTRGYFYKQSSPSPSGGNDFIIQDSSGTVVGYIDGATGNLYFKGQLHYNSNF